MKAEPGAKNTKKYRREVLLGDRRFAKYQKDFLAAVLTDEAYTINAALTKV